MAVRLFQPCRFENDCPQADSVAGLDLQPREVPWSRVAEGVYSRPCVADHFDRYDSHNFGHVGYSPTLQVIDNYCHFPPYRCRCSICSGLWRWSHTSIASRNRIRLQLTIECWPDIRWENILKGIVGICLNGDVIVIPQIIVRMSIVLIKKCYPLTGTVCIIVVILEE